MEMQHIQNRLPSDFYKSLPEIVERKKVNELTTPFYRSLRTTGGKYSLYSFNMTVSEKYTREQIGWFDDDNRNAVTFDLYDYLIHRLSSRCCSNYQRNTHASNRFISWGAIEHFGRNGERVSPHIHAMIAVRPEWEQKFLSCFKRLIGSVEYQLNPKFIKGAAFEEWNNQVASVRMRPIDDAYSWSSYCLKQVNLDQSLQDKHPQPTMVFNHNGTKQERLYETH